MNFKFYASVRLNNPSGIDAKTENLLDMDANPFTINLFGDENSGYVVKIPELSKQFPGNEPFDCLIDALNELCYHGVIIAFGRI